jgi:hypothetical protein
MMPFSTRLRATILAAGISLVLPTIAIARGDWPDGPYKEWFQNLQRPDNDKHPERLMDSKSLYCCGAADVVKTKFKVESNGGPYPDDTWYAWLDESWTKIPPEKIVKDFAPNGEPYLFVLAGTIQCFVPPKGGF